MNIDAKKDNDPKMKKKINRIKEIERKLLVAVYQGFKGKFEINCIDGLIVNIKTIKSEDL